MQQTPLFSVMPCADNPHLIGDMPGLVHWQCTLTLHEKKEGFVVSMAEDTYGNQPPSEEMALALLAADIDTIENHEEIMGWSSAIRQQIGDDTFDGETLLNTFQAIVNLRDRLVLAFGPQWLDALPQPGGVAPSITA